MKTIIVNLVRQTVTVNNQTCNFYEAGLMPNGKIVTDPDIIEEHLRERHQEDIDVVFEEGNSLAEKLLTEIGQEGTEPNVLMFVDSKSIFWVTKDGHYVWIQDHRGIDDYIDEIHQIEPTRPTDKNIDGVSYEGIYWMNIDFESPYHIFDFTSRIREINI